MLVSNNYVCNRKHGIWVDYMVSRWSLIRLTWRTSLTSKKTNSIEIVYLSMYVYLRVLICLLTEIWMAPKWVCLMGNSWFSRSQIRTLGRNRVSRV